MNAKTKPATPRKSWLKWSLYGLIATLILSAAILYFALETIARHHIDGLLTEKALEKDISYQLDITFPSSVTLTHIQIGDDLTIGKATATLSLASLVELSIDQIKFEHVVLKPKVTKQGAALPDLAKVIRAFESTEKNTAPIALPFHSLQLDAEIKWQAPNEKKPTLPYLLVKFTSSRQGHQFNAKMNISDHFNRLAIEGEGHYDMLKDHASGSLTLQEMVFQTGVLQPDYFYAPLRKKIKNVSGHLGAGAQFEWKQGQLTSSANLTFKDLSATFGAITVDGMNSHITFDSLSPLSTPNAQTLHIATLHGPLILENGTLRFSLVNNTEFTLEDMRWQMGKGQFYTKETTVDLANLNNSRFTLWVKEIQLADLIALDPEQFRATGTLSGKIPFVIQNGNTLIERGYVSTNAPGTIYYTPPFSQIGKREKNLELVFSLLTEFHYDSLSLALHNTSPSHVDMLFKMKGLNPDVQEGRMVHLNINLSGNILEMIQSGLAVYQMPLNLIEGIQ